MMILGCKKPSLFSIPGTLFFVAIMVVWSSLITLTLEASVRWALANITFCLQNIASPWYSMFFVLFVIEFFVSFVAGMVLTVVGSYKLCHLPLPQ